MANPQVIQSTKLTNHCYILGPIQQVNQSAPNFNPPPPTLLTSNVDGGIQTLSNIGSTEQQVVGKLMIKGP